MLHDRYKTPEAQAEWDAALNAEFKRIEDQKRLVAAAPDMLQALRDLYHEAVAAGFDCRSGYGWPTALANADKAIAKATGSAP